jgi:hypothetical protein
MKINKFTLAILFTLSTQSIAWADNLRCFNDDFRKGSKKYIKSDRTTEKY